MTNSELSNANIVGAKKGDTLNDKVVTGLSLRVFNSKKSFYYYYRTRDGQQRRPRIGEYPAMTIATARKVAREIMVQVMTGKDPSEEWAKARRDTFTVAMLCEKYLSEYAAGKFKENVVRNYRSMLNKHIKGNSIGKKRVSLIEWEDIEALHVKISRKTPTQANRVVSFLSKVFSKAERWRYRPSNSNPCSGVEKNTERKRDRFLSPDEIQRLAATLQDPQKLSPRMSVTLWLLFLTGARRGEIAGRELHIVDGEIRLSDHKTARLGEDRVIQVPQLVINLVKQNKLEGEKLPIPDRVSKTWRDVRDSIGLEGVHLHDLRHSFASLALNLGYTLDQTGKQLGHRSIQTTHGYAHLMDHKSKEMVEAVANAVTNNTNQ